MPTTIGDLPAGSVSQNKKTGVWTADFDSRRWGRKQFRARTKNQARAKLNTYRKQLADGLDPGRRTVEELIAEDMAAYGGRAPESIDHRRWALGRVGKVIGSQIVADIDERKVEQVLAAQGDLSPRSQNAIRKAMVGLLDRAVRDGLLLRNPAREVKAQVRVRRRRLELGPLAELLDLLDQMMPTTYGPLINAIAATGMRTGEARGLRVEDVDGEVLHVRGQLRRDGVWSEPKTEAGVRDLEITPRMRRALDEAQRRRHPKAVYLFSDGTTAPLPPMGAYQAWRKAQPKAQAEGRWSWPILSLHDLRGVYLTTYMKHPEAVLDDAAAVAGHTSVRVIAEHYLHTDRERVKRSGKIARESGLG